MKTFDVKEALEITQQLREATEGLWKLIATAYQGKVWLALGYESWDAYCTGELSGLRLHLPREERRETMRSLRESGLSLRAIAAATGYDKHTVSRDLQEQQPGVITGCNGKKYQPKASFPDSFWRITYDLAKLGDRITKLTENGKFGDHKERIKEISLSDLLRTRAALDEVIAKLEGALVR